MRDGCRAVTKRGEENTQRAKKNSDTSNARERQTSLIAEDFASKKFISTAVLQTRPSRDFRTMGEKKRRDKMKVSK